MAKLTLTDMSTGYQSLTNYNANNSLIEAFAELTLTRDGTAPNTMTADFDLNSNDLLNGGVINYTTLTDISDIRDKRQVTFLPTGIDFIEKLVPCVWTWDVREGGPARQGRGTGFVAQDLLETVEDFGAEDSNLVDTSDPDQYKVSTHNLIPILVKAIQELSAEMEYLRRELREANSE